MTQVVLTSGTNWTVPSNMVAGMTVSVEGWGAGGGGGARSSGAAFGSGGGGGQYVQSTYELTPNDITSGIPYVIGAGGGGGTGGDGVSGTNTTWSTNNLNLLTNSSMSGAVVATNTIPTNWTLNGTPLGTIVGTGIINGLPYIDVNWNGTTASTHMDLGFDTFLVSTASTAYCGSAYVALIAGSLTNITSVQMITDDWTSANAFIAAIITTTVTPTATLTRFSGTASTASNGLRVTIGLQLNWTAGNAINLTLRVAGAQIEAGTTPSAFKSTPGYMVAPGGSRSNGVSGGAGGTGGIGNGTIKNAGGAGAAWGSTTTGAGGGGAGGKDGTGGIGTTTAGGQGDGAVGGLGGLDQTTNPGLPGTANTEGGGGGGSLSTVGAPGDLGGAGGMPGGGGGACTFESGTGPSTAGAGAAGQIRITYFQDMSGIFEPNNIQLWSP